MTYQSSHSWNKESFGATIQPCGVEDKPLA